MIDVGELVVGGVGLVSNIITGVVTWFLSKRKYNSEVDQTLIENMEKSLEFYTKLSDDNSQRLDDMMEENTKLRDEVIDLRKQVSELVFNICLDLTCQNRIRENELNRIKNAQGICRLDTTKGSSRRRGKPADDSGDSNPEE